jgi:serine/threonine protein kinase
MELDSLKQVSKDVKDLIKKLLETDPSKRLSASEALEHQWLKPKQVQI